MISTLELIIFYSYGIPLFVLNVRAIYILATNRGQFLSCYYTIFILFGVNYCLLYLTNNYALRFPSIPFLYNLYYSKFTDFTRWHAPIAFLRRFCSYSISFGGFLIELNRLTAVWKYSQHENLWKRNKKIWITYWVVGTSIFSIQELFNQHRFGSFPDTNNSTIVYLVSNNYYNYVDTRYWSLVVISTSLFFGIITLSLTLFFWRKRKAMIPTKYHSFERRLIWLTVVLYSLGVIAFLYNLLNPIFFNQSQNNLAYVIVSDMVSLIPVTAIIIASPPLRIMIFPDWLKGKVLGFTDTTSVVVTLDLSATERVNHFERNATDL